MKELTTDDQQWLNDRLDGVQTRVVGIPPVRQGELCLRVLSEEEIRFYLLLQTLHQEVHHLSNDTIILRIGFCRSITPAEFDEHYRRIELIEERFWSRYYSSYPQYTHCGFAVRRQDNDMVLVAR